MDIVEEQVKRFSDKRKLDFLVAVKNVGISLRERCSKSSRLDTEMATGVPDRFDFFFTICTIQRTCRKQLCINNNTYYISTNKTKTYGFLFFIRQRHL